MYIHHLNLWPVFSKHDAEKLNCKNINTDNNKNFTVEEETHILDTFHKFEIKLTIKQYVIYIVLEYLFNALTIVMQINYIKMVI